MTCGKGYKHRQTWCQFGEERLDDRFCDSSKPESVQACQQQECASWQVGPWGQVRITIYFIAANKTLFWCMSCLGMTGITMSIFLMLMPVKWKFKHIVMSTNVISRSAVVAAGYWKKIITAAVWAEIDHKNGMRLGTRQRTIFGIFALMVSTSKTKITMLL